jgi:hypothetical protein
MVVARVAVARKLGIQLWDHVVGDGTRTCNAVSLIQHVLRYAVRRVQDFLHHCSSISYLLLFLFLPVKLAARRPPAIRDYSASGHDAGLPPVPQDSVTK